MRAILKRPVQMGLFCAGYNWYGYSAEVNVDILYKPIQMRATLCWIMQVAAILYWPM